MAEIKINNLSCGKVYVSLSALCALLSAYDGLFIYDGALNYIYK